MRGFPSGCGKKTEALSVFTFNGDKVDGDLTNFVLRYEQSNLDDIYAYYGSMMNQDIWTMDDGQGLGISTWDNFKSGIGETVEKLLLTEEHAEDYGVSLTDDEKAEITKAASAFIAANDEATLKSMSATQETVERYLTLSKIKSKVEIAMAADVDTEVSDEEAAQRKVSYIEYTPTTEAQTEEATETEMGSAAETEADVENATEAEIVGETMMTEAEPAGETVMTEAEETAAKVETEADSKTKAGDETEAKASDETEAAASDETEAAASDETGAAAESETETEDPAMAEAKVKYREMAETQLAALVSGSEDFETAAARVLEESVAGVTSSEFTFGKDDTYPDAAIIEATEGLEDGTLVEKLIEVDDSMYILYVDKAFDEEATEDKKEEIVLERKQDKVDEIYQEWIADEKFETDSEALGNLLKERTYTISTPEETEEAQEAVQSDTETELYMEVNVETEISVETETEA